MAKEIERKFLVTADIKTVVGDTKGVPIAQGYLSKHKNHVVRIRRKGDKGFITIKGPKRGITCDEYEYQIPYEDATELLTMCDCPVITKTRYEVKDEHNQLWEVDVFHGINEGLVVAEIELKSEKTLVKTHSWTGKEVTFDKRYTNVYLSSHKVPKDAQTQHIYPTA